MGDRLAGKVAIVTGGSRGIGKAIAAAMAREGANVVIASRKLPGLEAAAAEINAEAAGSVLPCACHVGDPAQIAALVAHANAAFGTVDVLVNNAATNVFFGPLLKIDEAAFDKTFEVNLKSAWRLSCAVARRLVAEGKPGSIINIASIVGLRAAPMQGVYGMTKAALISMTQMLAIELGGATIRVNAIAPGLVDTKLAAAIVRNDALTAQIVGRGALHRVAQPDEIAGLAVFLASEEASYLTGQTIPVDGGFTTA